MSDWQGIVEEPNAPEGIADSGEFTDSAIRVDPVSGDVPSTPGHDVKFDEDTSLPGLDADDPLIVSIREKVIATSEVPAGRLVTGHAFISDGSRTQLVGQSGKRRRVVVKVSSEATDDYVLIGNTPDGLEFVGYRIDDGDREPFHVSDALYAHAVGGDANVYWFAEEDAIGAE